jgi:transposase
VRKVIPSQASEFHYERSRQPLPRIAEAYVPLSFAPGLVARSRADQLINGRTVTVKIAHVRLCHSVIATRCSCAPIRVRPRRWFFDAHNCAFAFFEGTCTRTIYDNMKTAVERLA